MIDLRSDTASRPTAEMRAAMAAAEVGDEQLREDPTVNELQRRAADLLGHEAALFLPTATMANQIALRVLTRPGALLVAEERTHVMIFEAGGPAVHSGLVMRGLPGTAGRIAPEQLQGIDDLVPGSIVVLENTHRSAGGCVWPLDAFDDTVAAARGLGMAVHLDGARLFNAAVASGIPAATYGGRADMVTVCFSKGLGCPLGAVLAGSRERIEEAWEGKFLFGGAMRLPVDPELVETNFVGLPVPDVAQARAVLEAEGVLAGFLRPGHLRLATYLDVTDEDIEAAIAAIPRALRPAAVSVG
jgi:threonine aldolase